MEDKKEMLATHESLFAFVFRASDPWVKSHMELIPLGDLDSFCSPDNTLAKLSSYILSHLIEKFLDLLINDQIGEVPSLNEVPSNNLFGLQT